MSGIRSKDTKPEILIRKALFAKGFRYRVNDRRYPGTPDIVLPKYRAIIFVHGCFWHVHKCRFFKWPDSNRAFWKEKLRKNADRDRRHQQKLHEDSWRICVIWECEIKDKKYSNVGAIANRLAIWLENGTGDMMLKGAGK